MNIFRLAGDMSHVASILILMLRLIGSKQANGERSNMRYGRGTRSTIFFLKQLKLILFKMHFELKLPASCISSNPLRSIRLAIYCVGISLKTQELFFIVFCTRYLDLFTTYYSFYNTYVGELASSRTSLRISWKKNRWELTSWITLTYLHVRTSAG